MTDRSVFRTVVIILGLTLILCVASIAVLSGLDKNVPGILENLAVGSLTGLAGLLAKGPHDEPQDVTVVNRQTEPVPVDAGHASVDLLAALMVSFTGSLLALIVYRVLLGS